MSVESAQQKVAWNPDDFTNEGGEVNWNKYSHSISFVTPPNLRGTSASSLDAITHARNNTEALIIAGSLAAILLPPVISAAKEVVLAIKEDILARITESETNLAFEILDKQIDM